VKREFKVEEIPEGWTSYAKNWQEKVQQLEIDGWRVLNIQQGWRGYNLTIWMVRESETAQVPSAGERAVQATAEPPR
jgi:uncharacterized protein YijF (DUF1287 family)